MPETYAFTIQNDKLRSYNRIGYLLIIINILCLFFIASRSNNAMISRYAMVGGLLTLLWVVLTFLRYYSISNSRMRLLPGYLFPAFIWFQLGYYWVTVTVVLLAILDYLARRPLLVQFTAEQIVYPSLPVQEIAWADLQNLVLKDGLLTIDYKNNRVRQVSITDDLSTGEEAEFNTFAAGKLTGVMSDEI